MKYEYFLYEKKEGICYLAIHRPEVRNAMNNDCWKELTAAIAEADTDPEVRVVILTGTGDKAFISGADIHSLKERNAIDAMSALASKSLQAVEGCRKPVIAAVNGTAFGGGFEVALACDVRVVSKNAKFGLPEVNLGILPGAGGTQRLARVLGIGIAKEIILAGRVIPGEEAVSLGLAMAVTEPGGLLEKAEEIAKTMMKKAPISLDLAKKLVNASMDMDRASGLFAENLAFSLLMGTEDKTEGVTAFLEKRTPSYRGR